MLSIIFAMSILCSWPFLSIYEFFIPEKDGEHREPSIYKGRDGRRDKRCSLSYCLTSTSQRGGSTGKVNLITVSLNPHTQITASEKTLLQNTFIITTVDYYKIIS